MPPTPSALRLVSEPPSPNGDDGARTSDDGARTSDDILPAVLSEKELVRGLQQGDPAACDRVYRLYAKEVWRMLRRILGDDRDIDDIHHEVFVQALRSAARFRGDAKLKTWLIGIAINCARTKLRSRRRRWWLRFVAPDQLPEGQAPACDDDTAITANAVYELMDKLPTDERIAFTLRFVEGMSIHEIAQATKCSEGTIKRRMSRASKRFFALAQNHPALESLCAARTPS